MKTLNRDDTHRLWVASLLCHVVLMLCLLAGCSPKDQGLNSGTQHEATPTSTLISGPTPGQLRNMPSPDIEGVRSILTALPAAADEAPSYEEIKKNIDRIMKRDQYPDGPPRNFEGLADPTMAIEFPSYVNSLRGKAVRNWQGWVLSVSESEYDKPDTKYDLGLRMEVPTDSEEPIGGVYLEDVPHQQVRDLGFAPSVERQPTIGVGQYRAIVFDGVILGALDSGQLLIDQVSIRVP